MATNTYSQLGRSAASIFGGNPQARQAGELAGLQQAHLESTISAQQAKMAADAAAQADASPEETLNRTLIAQGIPTNQGSAISSFFKTGQLPQSAMTTFGAPLEDGQSGPSRAPEAPAWAAPAQLGKIAQAFADARMLQGGDAKSLNDIALARGTNQETGALGQALGQSDLVRYSQLQNKNPLTQVQSMIAQGIQSGALTPAAGGKQLAATDGKPLYSQNGEGSVLDVFGGGVDQTNPLALTTLGLRKAQTSAANASAASSSASAAKTRQDTAMGAKGQYDASRGILIDPRTGEARPVMLDGQELGAKPEKLKDIPANVNAKIIEGQQGLTNIDRAIAAVQANPGAFGISNAIPGAEKAKQWWSGDQNAIDARAQVANIGSLTLHDRSGAAVSASEFPRLAPFIPSASDTDATVVTKLLKMKQIAEDELGLYAGTYNQDSGYKPSQILLKRSAAQPVQGAPAAARTVQITSDADYNALPPGARFLTPDGRTGTKR